MSSSTPHKVTPLMEQYFSIKQQYPDALLFFQVGDFYELFFDDAKKASSFLALTLTKRGKNKGEDIPLCGVPVHALRHYLIKLIKGGFNIALCDQLEKPQPGTVVRRGVTQVFTPGTLLDDQLLDNKSASYLLSLHPGSSDWSLVFAELLTAQLFATIVPAHAMKALETELTRFSPDEVLLPGSGPHGALVRTVAQMGYQTTPADEALMRSDAEGRPQATGWINQQFSPTTARSLLGSEPLLQGMNLLYGYLLKNQQSALSQFKTVTIYEPDDFLILDRATQKNLEVIENAQDGGRKHTLFAVLDRANTSMGSRTIKKWLQRPLVQHDHILARQEVVRQLIEQPVTLMRLEELFAQLADLERIIGRIALGKAALRDYTALSQSLALLPPIKLLLGSLLFCPLASAITERIGNFVALHELLTAALNDDPLGDAIIRPGFNLALDELKGLVTGAQEAILALEQQEVAATGIGSLKIRYNNISGYYLEITDTHTALIPPHYQHLQTLVGRKRFTYGALQELEQKILRAQNDISAVEQEVYEQIKAEVAQHLSPLRSAAQALAQADALLGFARAAQDNRYIQPVFNDNRVVQIDQSRHPVVEQVVGHAFVSNQVALNDAARLIILTGPNMGGKSTYLRQIALITIMAQCGSFVPASSAQLCLFDRIFTRIGSGDNVAEGKSTFFVEMEETATICTQASKNSLVILDEVGRGTSTYDGMALAQAIIEYIATAIGATCLFATHYHELTQLEQQLPGIKNYYTECIEQPSGIIFTHTVKPGAVSQSFGLHVAQRANIPTSIVTRAQQILDGLPATHAVTASPRAVAAAVSALENTPSAAQLLPARSCAPLHKTLDAIDLDTLSPKKAFDLLWELAQQNRHQS